MSFSVSICMANADHINGQATFTHLHNSGMVGRFPYERMPTRKIFAVAQKKAAIVAMEMRIDNRMCHMGGSATSVRTYIVIGPKTGAREKPTERFESGFVMMATRRNHGSIMIMVIGAMSCCASFSELQIAPPIA